MAIKSYTSDGILIPLSGNNYFGNEIVGIREILLDLRLRVNYSNTITKLNSMQILFFFDIIFVGDEYEKYFRNR